MAPASCLKIIVASGNAVKINATKLAFAKCFQGKYQFDYEGAPWAPHDRLLVPHEWGPCSH